jgi:hypothetical protein
VLFVNKEVAGVKMLLQFRTPSISKKWDSSSDRLPSVSESVALPPLMQE